jgi:DNA invertase Pin-like site-specific DNA recombinase
MLFQMLGIFADYERAIIKERVRAGLARAKAQGKTLGRPRVEDEDTKQRIRKLRAEGWGMLKIATEVGCGTGRVLRVLDPVTWEAKREAKRRSSAKLKATA